MINIHQLKQSISIYLQKVVKSRLIIKDNLLYENISSKFLSLYLIGFFLKKKSINSKFLLNLFIKILKLIKFCKKSNIYTILKYKSKNLNSLYPF